MSKHLEMLRSAMSIDAKLGIGSAQQLFDKDGKKIREVAPTVTLPGLKLGQGKLQEADDEHGNNENNRRVAERVARDKAILAADQSGEKKEAPKAVDHHAPAREALLAAAQKELVVPVVESGVAPAAAAPAAPVVAAPAWKP